MGKETRLLEKIEKIIPGFHGYKQKELIREDDKLVREKVAAIIDDARRELEKTLNRCLLLNCEFLEAIDRIRKKALMVAERIRHSEYGYSGYFDRVKIREEELERLLEYDSKLLDEAERILEACREASSKVSDKETLPKKLFSLDDMLETLDKLILERNRMFKVK